VKGTIQCCQVEDTDTNPVKSCIDVRYVHARVQVRRKRMPQRV